MARAGTSTEACTCADASARAEAAGSFRPLVRRAPYFEHAALASLQGKIVEAKEVGSHSVMFVETTQIRVRADGDSLIYFDRNFHRVPRAWKGQ
ncbi:flavin reductase [Paraburkholderia sp. Clong3]|uniref:flavin reductase n=1 Tax=Paraburkholderia sp. Clong3 TaxID=2991061 RepID=UPI003D23455E